MSILERAIDAHGGYARRAELVAFGVRDDWIGMALSYGRALVRIRRGWFARPGERDQVIRAWRVGGRLTCVSAGAFHEGSDDPPVLHVEVAANAGRLRDPDDPRRRLSPSSAVVVHWTRHPGPGDRRAVTASHAEAVAAVCGVHAGPVRRGFSGWS